LSWLNGNPAFKSFLIKEKMEQEEYVTNLINYLCKIEKYQEFEDYLLSLGYTQDDIDDVD
jgi:hypothetical protein